MCQESTEDNAEVRICDCCGRDFLADTRDSSSDGVEWCPNCRPEY